jgi:hypothetical protein
MAENTLFTLVDQYGNSLENFRFDGKFTFTYSYQNQKPVVALKETFQGGIVYGTLPAPEKGLEYTQLVIEFESEFYSAPGRLLFKGQYEAPQKIVVAKKTLDPEQKNVIIKKSSEDLSQAVQNRVGGGIREL